MTTPLHKACSDISPTKRDECHFTRFFFKLYSSSCTTVPIQISHTQIKTHTIWGLLASISLSLNSSSFVKPLHYSQHYILPWLVGPFTLLFLCIFNHLSFSADTSHCSFLSSPFLQLDVKSKKSLHILQTMIPISFSDGVNIQSLCLISRSWFQACDFRNAAVWGAWNEVWFFQCLFLWQLHMQKNCKLLSKGIYFDSKASYSGLQLHFHLVLCLVPDSRSLQYKTSPHPLTHSFRPS